MSDSFKKGEWAGGQWNPSDDDDELPAAPRGAGLSSDDRALLELAARAIGARFEEVEHEGYGNLHFEDGRVTHAWNPLVHSDDAFDLQVALDLHVLIDIESAGAISIEWDFGGSTTPASTVDEYAPIGGDDRAAARRAITRAAAEIGKQQ